MVGEHDGAYAFTVGQRKGLKIGRPAADGKPRYVLDIEPVSNTVHIGPADALDVTEVRAERPVWTDGVQPSFPVRAQVQLRAHGEPMDATVSLDGDQVVATLDSPARGVAAGQALVVYRPDAAGDVVLGSATIMRSGQPALH